MLTATDKLSKRELERQIDASHFERSLSAAKLSPVARELCPGVFLVPTLRVGTLPGRSAAIRQSTNQKKEQEKRQKR